VLLLTRVYFQEPLLKTDDLTDPGNVSVSISVRISHSVEIRSEECIGIPVNMEDNREAFSKAM
jgi:hypothetical protein